MTTPRMGHYGVSVRRCWTISSKLWVAVVALHNKSGVKRCWTFKSDTISTKLWVIMVDLHNKSGVCWTFKSDTISSKLWGHCGRLA